MAKIDLSWFDAKLAAWPTELAGPKPSKAMLEVPLAFGKRQGIEALSIAMALRKNGYTVAEYLIASGANGAAHNCRKAFIKQGLLEVKQTSGNDGSGKTYRYTCTVTPKGQAVIDAAKAKPAPHTEAAKVTKPKKVKAKKAKVTEPELVS